MMDPSLTTGFRDFIDDQALEFALDGPAPAAAQVDDIVGQSLAKQPLSVAQTAQLLRLQGADRQPVLAAARELKRRVYGNRIVLFAPLYIGNHCVNDCSYCGFRRSNRDAVRSTLDDEQLRAQVRALEDAGHKRLILVYGEHPRYDADFIADTVRTVYDTRSGPHGEIRRVNINAAPLDGDGFRTVKDAGIGTYQIFQETYHHGAYACCHPAGTRKADYAWRLDGLSRAFEAGLDDMGIGALFGLHDWRFEVLGLVAHALHLQERYQVGPHTISFPRIQPADGMVIDPRWVVDDDDFVFLVAVLRLAVPYTGMILTAREPQAVRRRVMEFGVSQIDGGTRIELGAYAQGDGSAEQDLKREQFRIGDSRSLDEVMYELISDGYLPSFCTACYRLGRTGEHFMEFAVPGFIKRFCTPNGLTTVQEYLLDYASPETAVAGAALIDRELAAMPEGSLKSELMTRLETIRSSDQRDCYF